jgi:molybdenum cofactor synthesis domain-containing protein
MAVRTVSAGMVVIGDEILSGRTQDVNVKQVADFLAPLGVSLSEVRIVSDEADRITGAVRALADANDYVFTTGGIGPTHDDITADAVAAAFGVPCEYDDAAYRLLEDYFSARGIEYTEARKRMARMPRGAAHIENPISVAPGFRMGNVFVMAGVPSVFQAMLDNVVPTLRTGAKLLSVSVPSPLPEGTIGGPLGDIQKAHSETIIGSYPKYVDGRFWTELVIRSRSEDALKAAKAAVEEMLEALLKRN